ncbi:proline--tRNA ligase [Cysteiniphilum sp. JM-1]|uniref:proline--tRNA ligase n=1 Tax=Cysteiniphilum sp. JM-1 TaxID=2610891 RepID=UPI001243B934|nr:proline--tRNA ligase [Cysteiniphilum sp. JM-1]
MRVSQTLLATEKETPKDAELISHQYMLRAGLIRKLASGIYQWLPTGMKVLQKVQTIVREEMDNAGACEILMPSILPAELLQETHRWQKFGPELLKMQDRHERDFCYGPTHEESIVDIARKEIKSYKQLPLNLYQIQTKFRDEIRPRFGVMRAREFIMKDAYSFHSNYDCLEDTYQKMHQAYCNILTRMGLKFRVVNADAGAIGGSKTHEFQVLAAAGEDIVCYSNQSDYAANIEMAEYLKPDLTTRKSPFQSLEKTATPNLKTISDICQKFDLLPENTIKTIIIKDSDNTLFALVLRGDHELNEIKIDKLPQINAPFTFATEAEIQQAFNANIGSLGPVNSPIKVIADHSAVMLHDFVCGANEDDFHFFGANWDRDIKSYDVADLRNVVVGDISPDGKGTLELTSGIEVGHIFQLGDNYSKAMNANILDENGKKQDLIMGCYGFGVTRIIAAAIEQSHDDNGIIWPSEIAPYDISIIPMNMHKSTKVFEVANKLYNDLRAAGFDVLFDDRKERPGIMFADADLIGAPHQLIIGERGLESDIIEYKCRKTQQKSEIPYTIDAVLQKVCAKQTGKATLNPCH